MKGAWMARPWTFGWLAAGPLLALGTAMASSVATPQAPAQHCASHPASTLRALKEGTQRVVLVLKAFEPPRPAGAGLVVSLLTADKTRRHQVARLAVHPLRAFSAREPRRSQRFLVSLAGSAHLIEEGKPLCLEVAFEASGPDAQGGHAEIGFELANLPPAR